jgi:hypothetical protein
MHVGQKHAQFDLTLMCAESADNLVASFHYSTGLTLKYRRLLCSLISCSLSDLFERDTIKGMASHYETLLRSIVANPDNKLSQLNVISTEERK